MIYRFDTMSEADMRTGSNHIWADQLILLESEGNLGFKKILPNRNESQRLKSGEFEQYWTGNI